MRRSQCHDNVIVSIQCHALSVRCHVMINCYHGAHGIMSFNLSYDNVSFYLISIISLISYRSKLIYYS